MISKILNFTKNNKKILLISLIVSIAFVLFFGVSKKKIIFDLILFFIILIGLKTTIINKKSLIATFITLIFLIFIGEIYLRLTENKIKSIYPDYQNLLKEIGASNLKIIEGWQGFKTSYHEYFLWGIEPYKSKNLNITNYYNSRCVPNSYSLNESEIIIWLFGGSTMLELCATDSSCIANQIALNLQKNNIKAVVVNFGEAAFNSSLERIKFEEMLKVVSKKEVPNYAIFYDGYNDGYTIYTTGPGKFQGHLSRKIEAMVKLENKKLFLYGFSNILSEYSYLWKKYKHPQIEQVFGTCGTTKNEAVEKAVDYYYNNTRMIEGICNIYGIKPVFLLQPMIFTKNNLTNFEKKILAKIPSLEIETHKKYYEKVRLLMKNKNNFFDISNIFNYRDYIDFWDYGHTGPYSGSITGKEISNILRTEIKNTQSN